MIVREYETIFILRPDLGDDTRNAAIDRIRSVLEKEGGIPLKDISWGKRKLAYEIDKHLKGVYHYLLYLGTPGLTDEIERNFKMMDTVIKYMTVKVNDRVDAEKRKAEVEQEEAVRLAEEKERAEAKATEAEADESEDEKNDLDEEENEDTSEDSDYDDESTDDESTDDEETDFEETEED